MASYNYTFQSGDGVTPTRLNDARTVSDIVNADIKSDAAIAGTKISPNFGSQNISTTGDIQTQSGTLTVSSDTQTSIVASAAGNSTSANLIQFRKSRGTQSSRTVVTSGDTLGSVAFFAYDGASSSLSAAMVATSEGTVATDSIPTRIVFNTRASTGYAERMRITSAGNVGINTTSPSTTLDVAGTVTATQVNVSTSGSAEIRVSSSDSASPLISLDRPSGNSWKIVNNLGILRFQNGSPGIANATTDIFTMQGGVGASLTGDLSVTGDINCSSAYGVDGVQVVANRRTGWTAATGTATRTTFATSTVTLPQLAERVKALIDDLGQHGLIGT